MRSNALKFRQTQPVPRQSGEQARLKVVQGPDAGAVYVVTGLRASIGRGDDNDVMIADLKASRRHAEVIRGPKGWFIKDLGSSNGITHRGEEKREASLQAVDQVTVGATVFEFIDAMVPDQQLVAAPKSPIESIREQAALESQRERVRALGRRPAAGSVISSSKAPSASAAGPRKLLAPALMAILLVVYFVFDPEQDAKKAAEKAAAKKKAATAASAPPPAPNRDLASFYGSIQDTPETARQAEMFFRAGFREFREQNYLRARVNFENVLQVSPGHQKARLYYQKSEQAIAEQVKSGMAAGKRAMEAGKLRSAKGHFEAVLRLLYRDASNPKYEEARLQLEQIERQMKGAPSS